MTKESYIKENFPIEDLKGVGFFKENDTFEDMENKICKYFGFKNIFMYSYVGMHQGKPLKADINTFSEN